MPRLAHWIPTLAAVVALAGGAENANAEAKSRPAGAKVARPAAEKSQAGFEVLWGGRWWPAEILERREGLVKIHYTGWGAEWDEWIEPPRLRKAAARVPLKAGKAGQSVEIEWHGSWWQGEIIQTRSGLYKVHYTGWGPEWDEWVEPIRLRKTSR